MTQLTRFLRDEDGTVTIETLLILPVLFWCYLATFVFFNGFRADASNIKAAATIADVLSREALDPITPEFIDSLYALQGELSKATQRVLRVTVLRYDDAAKAYTTVWSQVRGGAQAHTNASLATLRGTVLPPMAGGEVGILVESMTRFDPGFTVGLARMNLEDVALVRPRFSGKLCWDSRNDGPWKDPAPTC